VYYGIQYGHEIGQRNLHGVISGLFILKQNSTLQVRPMQSTPQPLKNVSSSAITPQNRSLALFFFLVFALSVPFWLTGALTGMQLMDGLPISSLMTFCPMIAAVMLVYKEDKTEGVRKLLQRAFDYRRIKTKIWYVPVVLLMPGVMILMYGLMRLMRVPLPAPQLPILAGLVMFLVFFIAALGEEVGWTGYATDPMQARWSALQTGILLGLVWAVWHIIPFMQAHRSPTWIAWQCLFLVAVRVIMVWLYNGVGKSVFAIILFHAMINVGSFLFPNYGSHYDPRMAALLVTFVAAAVTFFSGRQTLSNV